MRRSARWTCAIIGMAGAVGCAQHGAAPLRRAGTTPVPYSAVPESVSVGYGTQPRRALTGAVGSVDGRTGQHDGVLRVEEMLRRVPGVMVTRLAGGSYSVRIRGGGAQLSANAPVSEPLFVLDGMPLPAGPGALDMVPPGDVERIDVLKDAEAAIYGSRAANGVILVRTRHWKR